MCVREALKGPSVNPKLKYSKNKGKAMRSSYVCYKGLGAFASVSFKLSVGGEKGEAVVSGCGVPLVLPLRQSSKGRATVAT